MALSTDISVPTDLVPVFPGRCVACEELTSATSKIAVDTNNFLTSFFLPIMILFGRKKIEFPLCADCKLRFFIQRWTREFISLLIIIVAVLIALPYFKQWNRQLSRYIVIGIGFLALIPFFVFDTFFPRWFDVTANKENTDYEFSSADYALDFYLLNRNEYPNAKIKFDGEVID